MRRPALLTFGERDYEIRPGESVLDAMARHGMSLPAACQAGACHSCLLRAVAGDPGEAGRRGLKPTLRARGYFLACVARPADDLTIAAAGPEAAVPAVLARREWLAADVLSVWLRPSRALDFRPGQHVTLSRTGEQGLARTYSIANLPDEAARDGLQAHVRLYPGGAMSGWLAGAAPIGARLGLGVPGGECFYLPGEPDQAMLLAGTGTGLAPLLAIVRDAHAHGHRGPVTVVCGASRPDRLYLDGSAAGRARPGDRPVRWRTAVRSRGDDVADVAVAELARLGTDAVSVYLCGGSGSVARTRRALFMAGMSLRHIHADEFAAATGPR